MTQFVSLSSGSNGNCYYIGNEACGILIDAGIGTRTIKKRLGEVGLSVDRVRCLLVSHDHFDHIRSLGTFAERFQKPVYATAPCIRAFDRHYCTHGYLGPGRCRELVPGEALEIEGGGPQVPGARRGSVAPTLDTHESIRVLPFRVPHDATDTVGFFIDFCGETFTFLTDLGAVTDDAVFYASRSRHLIVEANYDLEMLLQGSYPPELKERIRNGHGHLSNAQTAELVRLALTAGDGASLSGAVSSGSSSSERPDNSLSGAEDPLGQKIPRSALAPSDVIVGPLLQDVFLCHLSENNNTPELALATVSAALSAATHSSGIRLVALPRREPSEIFTW